MDTGTVISNNLLHWTDQISCYISWLIFLYIKQDVYTCNSWAIVEFQFMLSFGKLYSSFFQNLGVALPSHVYRTPSYQNWKNDEGNKIIDAAENIGISKISQVFAVDVTTIRKCLEVFIIYLCHDFFSSCDRTQSTFMERKICRESCLKMTRICGKMYDVVSRYYTTENPEYKKKFSCELQPYRNAGDSPECY